LETRAKSIEVYLVLFDEPVHSFLHERLGIVVVAPLLSSREPAVLVRAAE